VTGSTASQDKVERLDVLVVQVPTDRPEADGTLSWSSTTCVVVQAISGSDVGVGWTYAPTGCADLVTQVLAPVVCGRPVLDVTACWLAMVRQVRNATRTGVAGYAVSAVDCALWDLKARRLGVRLCDLLGTVRGHVPVYGSGGFTTYDDAQTVQQIEGWSSWGASAVKIKIGEADGTRPDRDVARIRLARQTLGPGPDLLVDANGGYRRKQALRLARMLPEWGVTWFEEPVSADDLAGLRLVRDGSDVDVAAGEYGGDLTYFERMCAAGAVDCLQVDASRCGGVTGWQRAVTAADAHGLDVSSHCAPALHLHLAASTPHLRHMEYFHDHVRIEGAVFAGVAAPVGGSLAPAASAPGNGLRLRDDVEASVARLGGTVVRAC
jgi:L-alanine-DL-glutamate epimerase-like enolase superfamily enzyme